MRALIVAAALLVVAPAAAQAAPEREGSLSAASPEFAWSGSAYGFNLAGEPCNTDHSCEDTLLHVQDAGTLALDWQAAAPAGPAWLGVTVYGSDASGSEGDMKADGGGLEDSGGVTARLEAGYYLVRVAGLLTSVATYDITAKLKTRAAPAPAAAPPAADPAPQPAAKPRTKCRKGKGKKARRKYRRCKRKQRNG